MKKALWLTPAAIVAVFFYAIKASPFIMTIYTLMTLGAYAATIVRYERDINAIDTDHGR